MRLPTPRPIATRRLLAAVLAVALAAAGWLGAALAPPASAATAPAGPAAVELGHLDWGVKGSFRSYVVGPTAHGAIAVEGGATEVDGDTDDEGEVVPGTSTFRFPGVAGSTVDGDEVAAAFEGSVRFTGHVGGGPPTPVLDLTISALRVEVDGGTGALVADVASRDRDTLAMVAYDDVALATLDLSGTAPVAAGEGLVAWADVPATLTEAGVAAFADFYQAGDALDPVSFTVPGEVPTGPGPTEPGPTEPGPTEPGPTEPGPTEPGPTEPGPTEPEVEGLALVTGGGLDWGVKASFRSYITGGIAHGQVTMLDGASTNPDGTYHFPASVGDPDRTGTYDAATGQTVAFFDGGVRFEGHHSSAGYLLQLTLSDLRVAVEGTAGVLVADVVSRPLEGDITNPDPDTVPVAYQDVPIMALDLSGVQPYQDGPDAVRWADVPTTLSVEAAPIFEGFYPAGTPFDPLAYTLALTEVPDVPPPPAEPTASLDKLVVSPGDELTVSGGGFAPGEQVEVWVLSDPVWVGTAVADGAGAVTFTFVVPEVPAGQHHVELRGISSGEVLRSVPFTVLAGSGGTGGTGRTGTLPRTGSDLGLGATGLALVLAGAALVAATRRRAARSGQGG